MAVLIVAVAFAVAAAFLAMSLPDYQHPTEDPTAPARSERRTPPPRVDDLASGGTHADA